VRENRNGDFRQRGVSPQKPELDSIREELMRVRNAVAMRQQSDEAGLVPAERKFLLAQLDSNLRNIARGVDAIEHFGDALPDLLVFESSPLKRICP
jgi:hypothetical protein